MAKLSSTRTGTVFIKDFDRGVITTIGAQLIDVADPCRSGVFPNSSKRYALSVAGVCGPDEYGGMVPIIFNDPDDAYQKDLIPQIHIERSALLPAPQRRQSPGYDYRIPAPQAKMVKGWTGETGPTMVEVKGIADPYDITYELHIRTRLANEVSMILRVVAGAFPPMDGALYVMDTEGACRSYDVFQESINDLSSIVDVQDREAGWTVSIRVEGEIDLRDPVIRKTVYKRFGVDVEVIPETGVVI